MKRSIFTRIMAQYFFIIMLLSVLILSVSYKKLKSHYLSTVENNLVSVNTLISSDIESMLMRGDTLLDTYIKKKGKEINTRITVVKADGTVAADSNEDIGKMENHSNRPEIMKAFEGEKGVSIHLSKTEKTKMLYVASPVVHGGKIIAVIRSSLFIDEIDRIIKGIGLQVSRIAVIGIIIAFIFAIIFARNISGPIKELIAASREVANGDFTSRVYLKNRDELKDLADNFNYMVGKIESLFAESSAQREEIERIISSLHDGLFVIDKSDKISLSNKSFREMIGLKNINDKFYWELLRNQEFAGLIGNIRKNRHHSNEEIEWNSKFYACSATYIPSTQEIIVILQDITAKKDLEKIKKDFVVNVSHELRTPLTAIKGFIETMEESVNKKSKEYLDIIKRHTDRLIAIVNDLLTLAELEEKSNSFVFENIALKPLIENVCRIFEKRIAEKGLELKISIPEGLNIRADAFKIEQLFINLIDNAVKYTEKGSISIEAVREDQRVLVRLRDTGIGIPPEYQTRIFERFFTVDKSHSRKLGGTGLGLAIVKHIVLLHNGSINIESSTEAGTTFFVCLPLKN